MLLVNQNATCMLSKSLQVLSFLECCVCSQDSYPLMNIGRWMFAMSSQCPPASRFLESRFIALLQEWSKCRISLFKVSSLALWCSG
jgi:hypothetical protein